MAAAEDVVSKGPLAPLDVPIDFRRYPAEGAAAALVRHYWLVEYAFAAGDRRDIPILVYPACNLVIEHDRSALYGPSPELAVQHLEGSGWAFGVLLQPATGQLLAGCPIDRLVGSSVDFSGEPITAGIRELMPGAGDGSTAERDRRHAAAIAAFERWLSARIPELDAEATLLNAVAAAVESDPDLTRVDELAARFGLSLRRLERLTARYVGLSPKWLIQRRRLQDAAARLRAEPGVELSALAAELGYADYAHFSRDFAATVGATPRDFAAATAPRAPG